MKAMKLTALVVATLASSAAMANVATDAAGTVMKGTKTIFSTLTNPAAVSAEFGSLGYGANVAWSVNDTTELQAGWAGGNITDLLNGDFKVNDITYDLSTDLSNPYLGVQMRPAANWFTVGAGVIVPDSDITGKAQRGQDGYVSLNGVEYNVANSEIEADIKHKNKLAPYATIGFRPNLNNKWGVFGEVGGAYMGETDATVRVTNNTGKVESRNKTSISNEEFARQAEELIENKDWAKWLPIVKVGATYRF